MPVLNRFVGEDGKETLTVDAIVAGVSGMSPVTEVREEGSPMKLSFIVHYGATRVEDASAPGGYRTDYKSLPCVIFYNKWFENKYQIIKRLIVGERLIVMGNLVKMDWVDRNGDRREMEVLKIFDCIFTDKYSELIATVDQMKADQKEYVEEKRQENLERRIEREARQKEREERRAEREERQKEREERQKDRAEQQAERQKYYEERRAERKERQKYTEESRKERAKLQAEKQKEREEREKYRAEQRAEAEQRKIEAAKRREEADKRRLEAEERRKEAEKRRAENAAIAAQKRAEAEQRRIEREKKKEEKLHPLSTLPPPPDPNKYDF